MRVVLHVPDSLEEVSFAGLPLRGWLARLVVAAGHSVDPVADGELALHVDGRFPALAVTTLGRLHLPGDAVHAVDGTPMAGVGRSLDEVRGGDRAGSDESIDVTDPGGLSRAERVVRRRLADQLERSGVHVIDPARLVLDATVEVEAGAVIWPDVVLRGATRVCAGAEVRSGCWIVDTHVGERAVVKPHCVCEEAWIGPTSQVGPMAHLRPGARLEGENRVGNFVEVKKAVLHTGAKASHLSYVGDADIGARANLGAGTITCNYDGFRKHKTVVGEGAFVGSNSALVAPVTIGAGAVVGAGSTISKDVPPDALVVERAPTKVLAGKGKALNDRNARLKAAEKAKREE